MLNKQALLEEIDSIIGSPLDHEKIIRLYYWIKEGKFDSPSDSDRMLAALENIAYGRIEGDYSDVRNYASEILSALTERSEHK